MKSRTSKWLKLGVSLVAVVAGVALLHIISPLAPGEAGRAYRNNTERDIDARALVYTEIGPVSEFLDEADGRYGGRR